MKRSVALDFGFKHAGFSARENSELNPIGAGAFAYGQQLTLLSSVCDDQLAAARIGNIPRIAVGVQRLPSGDAQARLERSRPVINAGVDYFARTGGNARAVRLRCVRNDNLTARQRQRARHCKADDAGPYDEDINVGISAHWSRFTWRNSDAPHQPRVKLSGECA
jgi:hypothetical protein